MYIDAVKVCTCQIWLKRFRNGDCDISDKPPPTEVLALHQVIPPDAKHQHNPLLDSRVLTWYDLPSLTTKLITMHQINSKRGKRMKDPPLSYHKLEYVNHVHRLI